MPELAFAFKYFRADGQWVELGPFDKVNAQEKRDKMAEFGAKCSEIYPVEVPAEQYIRISAERESYVAGNVAEFKAYLSAELNVLDAVRSYHIIYIYLREFKSRIERFLKQETPGTGMTPGTYSRDIEAKFALFRVEYLMAASTELKDYSICYGPTDGSVPEDISQLLEDLSREVLRSIYQ